MALHGRAEVLEKIFDITVKSEVSGWWVVFSYLSCGVLSHRVLELVVGLLR